MASPHQFPDDPDSKEVLEASSTTAASTLDNTNTTGGTSDSDQSVVDWEYEDPEVARYENDPDFKRLEELFHTGWHQLVSAYRGSVASGAMCWPRRDGQSEDTQGFLVDLTTELSDFAWPGAWVEAHSRYAIPLNIRSTNATLAKKRCTGRDIIRLDQVDGLMAVC